MVGAAVGGGFPHCREVSLQKPELSPILILRGMVFIKHFARSRARMLRPPGAEAVCQHFMAASVALDFSDVYMTPHGTREVKHLVSTSALPSYSGWRMQGSWACSARSEVLLPSSS